MRDIFDELPDGISDGIPSGTLSEMMAEIQGGMPGIVYVNLLEVDDRMCNYPFFQSVYKRQIVELRKYGRIKSKGNKYIYEILDPMCAIVRSFLKSGDFLSAITEMMKIIDEVMYLKQMFTGFTPNIDGYIMSCDDIFSHIQNDVKDANIRSILFEYLRDIFYNEKYSNYPYKTGIIMTLINLSASRAQLEIAKSIYNSKLSEMDLMIIEDDVEDIIRSKERELDI